MTTNYRPFLKTLRRVPDDIILAIASREINTEDVEEAGHTCLCGWAMREYLARLTGFAAEDVDWTIGQLNGAATDTPPRLVQAFGGWPREWQALYLGICRESQLEIEEAFARRVAECVP